MRLFHYYSIKLCSVPPPLWNELNQILHFSFLKLTNLLFCWWRWLVLWILTDNFLWSAFHQIGWQLHHSNSTISVANQNNGIDFVEWNVSKLWVFDRFSLSQTTVLIEVDIVNVNFLKSGTRKHSWGIRSPHCIDHDHSHVKQHYLRIGIRCVPYSNRPISRSWDERCWMIAIPLHFVDCQ
jgi:hypothetical protein